MIKRTMSVDMIITFMPQMILCVYITDVSRNLTFIISIADGNFMKLKCTTNITPVVHRLNYLNTTFVKP